MKNFDSTLVLLNLVMEQCAHIHKPGSTKSGGSRCLNYLRIPPVYMDTSEKA
jgi:hypothetical protein